MSLSAPLRFLGVTLGGWVVLRAAILLGDIWVEPSVAAPGAEKFAAAPSPTERRIGWSKPTRVSSPAARSEPGRHHRPLGMDSVAAPQSVSLQWPHAPRAAPPAPAPPPLPLPGPAPSAAGSVERLATGATRSPGRWSASAWMLARNEAGADLLAPGGTLGGSQAGMRFLYRLGRDTRTPLALSARFYLPLRSRSGAEVSAGLDWRPFTRLPLHLLAERRQALGREGRSAFALTAYGGHQGPVARRLVLDAYAQAGVVGLSSRDAFFDGSLRLSVPLGRFELGAGAWAAAQPGAERLDFGPSVSMRVPAVANARLRADWRFRMAGGAAPGSGPAVTLATDF